jgi:glycerol-3-phosphate O-acyltransferase
MTVQSYLRDPKRPVVFIPVYFGYERIVEGKTYLGELSGRPKEKETIFGLLKTLPALRSKFGKVHVNFGTPIALDELLAQFRGDTRSDAAEDRARPVWLSPLVDALARRIMVEINAAAAVTPVNLVAMVMLATPRQVLPEIDLSRQLDLYRRLLQIVPYSRLVTVAAMSGVEMIEYVLSMSMIERQAHPLGDVIRMTGENAVLATYYRNNILHLFAMPSLLACCFLNNATMRTSDVQRLARRIYPYIADELFLRWPETEVDAVMASMLQSFVQLGLLAPGAEPECWDRPATTSIEAIQLSALAQATIQLVERYYLAISSLLHAGSGRVTQDVLEQRCHLMAQRIAMMYGIDAPEFFDKSLFRNFIDRLHERDVIRARSDATLEFGEALLAVAVDARWVLSEQIRHSILQVTHR